MRGKARATAGEGTRAMARDPLDLVEGAVEARMENREAREREAHELDFERRLAEQAMTHRTQAGRRFEEHRCGMAPWGWRLRRFAAPNNPYDSDQLPCYVWAVVRTEPPDDWVDGYECHSTVTGKGQEPHFCPWCGAPLKWLPDKLRGWCGR